MSLGLAALLAWLLTVGIGGYMLRTWIAAGGLRRQRATGVGVPPGLVFGHAGAAVTGLAIWLGYLGTGWRALAWLGVALVCAAICLGVCTVTLWTPYPVRPAPGSGDEAADRPGPARTAAPRATGPLEEVTVTDEMIAGLLAEPPPRRRTGPLLPLVPVVHGLAAVATFLLSVTAALRPAR
jgi:hypothetical protein